MSPPLNFTEALLDPLHSAIYFTFMLVACAIFSKTWYVCPSLYTSPYLPRLHNTPWTLKPLAPLNPHPPLKLTN